jgi:ketosteroid isomerase-like protein
MKVKSPRLSPPLLVALGALAMIGAKAVLSRMLLIKFRRDVAALNAGDHQPILSAYAEDAVIRFNDGDHRFAGEHRGRAQIERFFRNFVAAGITGEIRELYAAGPPWRLALLVRFDDRALAPGGDEIYRNRTVLLVRTRWGRVVWQEDFYEDTGRINELEDRLRDLGVDAVT